MRDFTSVHETVIGVDHKNAIISDEETWVDIWLDETMTDEALFQMKVPVSGGLLYSIQISF